MKTRLLALVMAGSALASVSQLASAEELGTVISSTPVLKRVSEPRTTCTTDNGRERCTTEMVTEDRTIGYKVVYEYAGKQREVQLPFPPGKTIPLEISPAGPTGYVTPTQSPPPTQTYAQPVPTYQSSGTQVIERVVREPVVYVERDYYPSPVYRTYYSDPIYPLVGLGLAASAIYYGTRWNHRHWNYGHRHHHGGRHRGR